MVRKNWGIFTVFLAAFIIVGVISEIRDLIHGYKISVTTVPLLLFLVNILLKEVLEVESWLLDIPVGVLMTVSTLLVAWINKTSLLSDEVLIFSGIGVLFITAGILDIIKGGQEWRRGFVK